jgi:hypothetical protein
VDLLAIQPNSAKKERALERRKSGRDLKKVRPARPLSLYYDPQGKTFARIVLPGEALWVVRAAERLFVAKAEEA